VVSFGCFDSPLLMNGGSNITESAIEETLVNYCFGYANMGDDFLPFADQFLHGLKYFQGFFITSKVSHYPPGEPECLTMPVILHWQVGKTVYIGPGLIDRSLMFQKSVGKLTDLISTIDP